MKIKLTFISLFLLLILGGFAQTITINPTSANRGQKLPVTITGTATNFARGSNTITFIKQGSPTNSVNITNLTVISNTTMGGFINIASNAPLGTYSVNVTNSLNTPVNLINGFTVNGVAPSLVTIIPNTATQGQQLKVTITGQNTNFSSGSNTLHFFKQGTESFNIVNNGNNIPLSNNIIQFDALVKGTAPLGVYSVGVKNAIDGLVMLNNSFTVTQTNKAIASISPNSGKQNQQLTVTITGVNTQFNTGSPTLFFMRQGSPTNDIQTINFNATSNNIANATIHIASNATLGLYDILYYNINDGTIPALLSSFTVNAANAPSLVSITPNTASQGQGLNVTITGTNTHFSSGSNTLHFFSKGTETFDILDFGNSTPLSNNSIVFNAFVSPSAALGIYSVGVENNLDGLVMLNNSFTVGLSNKSITNVVPNKGKQNQQLTVTITGVNTKFNSGSPTIYFIRQGSPTNDIGVLNFAAISATSATVQVSISPNAALGLYDIGYFNLNDGAVLKPDAFTVEIANGINEIEESIIKIFPNPAKNILNIESKNNITSVQIVDLLGKLIMNNVPQKQTPNLSLEFSDIQIPKGIYFITVRSIDGIITKKVIIE
ncbi:MAG: T9SS type A sorting domain-containing protein [Bacteroidetes bacterium]|nr:T9SS type A sorting domain-containing protein [Bacteroidota bacterium]